MRKRLSNFSWISWGIIFVTGIVIANMLSFTEMQKLRYHDLKFFNIRSVNFESLRTADDTANKQDTISNNSLIFILNESNLLFGKMADLIAPDMGADIVLLDRATWQQNISEKILNNQKLTSLFPLGTVGIAIETTIDNSEYIDIMGKIKNIIYNLNKKLDTENSRNFLIPNIVLFQVNH